ncbi:NAD(P)H-hydrate epimerase isoform X1 [Leptidea sinapis]|uniref:NAD(P)H-hydrate epimerase isoform X1 n=1 Tax=Leptidea sinapis TaxID=189913 RepID=UPI002141EE67|nr:NAD(P)H-hydrate epimerase isoform X1 [Leptidea sinapis]
MLITRLVGTALFLRVANSCKLSIMGCDENNCRNMKRNLTYLSQQHAAELDQDLFNDYKFSVDQLMELAGLSVATAVAKVFPASSYNSTLIVCGPGNNGGDGLVAARHMTGFGYSVAVYYPKRTPKPLYENLLCQCEKFGVKIIETLPPINEIKDQYKLVVDALFGFSFKPPVRDVLKPALDALIHSGVPVCSVDIPSGWDVEKGPGTEAALKPELLISLSAPKQCAKPEFIGDAKHYLGGRFLPPGIIQKYNLTLPPYPDQEQVVEL